MCANLLKCCGTLVIYFALLQNAELSVTFFAFVQKLWGLKKPDNSKGVYDLSLCKSGNRTGPLSEVRLTTLCCHASQCRDFHLIWKCGVSHLESEDCNGVWLLVCVTPLCSSLTWSWTCCSLKSTKINPQHYSLAHLVYPINFLEMIGNYPIIQRYNLNPTSL